ncbi:hypothetical protein HPB52_010015 [Rhipicephalus sanguineus]|uniref:Uncharacterized protein n=1 Tax=Rhipicephalus sanguineus TaxID=34632 RepID=A0A9D4PJE3_RHISA|nr:hypothetical protein HPB52_010015 [Rhipicephalus sanguineus]
MPFHRSLFGRHRDKEWWDAWDYPSRIFDQKFGVALRDEDLFDRDPFARRPLSTLSLSSPRRGQVSGGVCDVVPRSTGVSEVVNDDSKFEVRLDVSFFNPSDITVKVGEPRACPSGNTTYASRDQYHLDVMARAWWFKM